jgi:2-iminoacetate synthase ThiH
VQEIILQNYVPNRSSRIPAQKLSRGELGEIAYLVREALPDVSLQIPPNLNPNWPDLLALGINDLGGISRETDVINSENPWPPIEKMAKILQPKKYNLRKRLPIYPKYYQQGWYSARVGAVIEKWIQSEDEYQYYAQ